MVEREGRGGGHEQGVNQKLGGPNSVDSVFTILNFLDNTKF